MKVITRCVFDMTRDGIPVIEETSYEYEGPVALCGKSSPSTPQPVDPYTQAAAQYGLATGTANYNARLNRPNQQNAIGSTGWQITGYDNPPSQGGSSGYTPGSKFWNDIGGGRPYTGGGPPATGGLSPLLSVLGRPGQYTGGIPQGKGSGAPVYTQTTTLAPQFQSALEKPIDTSGIAGMPGGPSTAQDLDTTRNALYNQQMRFLAPEQALQSEQTDSNLANMGATIGSPAWNNEQDRLAREQELAKSNARDQAITGGGAEQSRLFAMGDQSLRDQLLARDAPISEFQSLLAPQGGVGGASTPDIMSAFGQQYQGQLNAANAQTASNNATTSDMTGLIAAALMFA